MSSMIGSELDELTQLQMSILPDEERELLMRCAPLRRFSADVLSELQPDGEATLARLTTYSFVQKVSEQPGMYRLRDDMRRALIESWWEEEPDNDVPPELSELSARLAHRLKDIPDTDRADIVGLQLFAEREPALEAWKTLFIDAEQRFDLLRCRSLLALLSWMADVFPDIEAVREEYQTYLDARSFWTDEWYRTSAFVLPQTSATAFEEFLSGKGRMLELRGFAGYGKTTHLRWLIARRCVPAPDRTPCARIDFDLVDALAATRHPHLVLLELADQLDRQLSGDAFGKLVRAHAAEHARLFRRERAVATTARDVREIAVEEDRSSASADISLRFSARLAEMSAGQRVVLIFDTLEVPLHLPDTASGPAIKPLFEALADVQRQAPCVRLVLAGRYNIEPELRNLFPDTGEPFELPRFTTAEAREYLVQKRGLTRGDQIDAAIEASDRVPFSLALLADLIDQDPAMSARLIAAYRGAEFAYLVERVVKRIEEQPVRWVLRYAAIPRRFDYEFVRDVIWRRAREEMAGTGDLDDPRTDRLPQEVGAGTGLWQVGESVPTTETAIRTVWHQVRRYASGSSWIGPDEQDSDALRLQSEVVKPLRELLRDKDITPVLHNDAVEYFLARAAAARRKDGPNADVFTSRTLNYLREAVFHRFQMEGEAAGAWWRAQIHTADAPEVRFALADELARQPEYSDQHGRPIPRGDGYLAAEDTLQEARLELCLASAELATKEPPEDVRATSNDPRVLWQIGAEALNRLDAWPTDALPSGRVALARAAVTIGTSAAEYGTNVRAALEEAGPTPRERLWIAVLEAQRLVEVGSPLAGERLTAAKKLAEAASEDRDLRRRLAFVICKHDAARGAYTEAIVQCKEARGLGDPALFQIIEANLRLLSGDAEKARLLAAEVGVNRPLSLIATLVAARSWRSQMRLDTAAKCAQKALSSAQAASEVSTAPLLELGYALLEVGATAASLLQVENARTAFGEALRTFTQADYPEAAASCHVQAARLHMRSLGHLRAAGVALDHATRAAPAGGESSFRALLLRAELARRLEDSSGVVTALSRAESLYEPEARPTWAANLAVSGLRFGEPKDRKRYAELLAKSLGLIHPPTARLRLLDDIEIGPVLKSRSAAAKQLRDQVIPSGGWDHELSPFSTRDRAVLRVRAAAFARLLNDMTGAERLLATALEEFRECGQSTVELREVLLVARMLSTHTTRLVTEVGKATVDAAMSSADQYPLLAAAAIIEYLEAALETGTDLASDRESLCAQASALLAHGISNADAWSARLAEQQASVGGPEASRSFLQAAMRLYAAAGDVRKVEQVSERVGGPEEETELRKPSVVVDVSLNGDVIAAKFEGWRVRLWGRRPSASLKLRDVIGRWANSLGSEPYPLTLPDLMLDNWQRFEAAMAELIDGSEVSRRQRRAVEPAELSVRVHDGRLQGLPWELASDTRSERAVADSFRRMYRSSSHPATDTRLIRLVQAGLNLLRGSSLQVDGVSGPNTARVLADWQLPGQRLAQADDPDTVQELHQALLQGARPLVMIAQAAPTPGRRRSYAVERRYARAGMEATSVADARATLPLVLRREPPPVILHFVGGFVAAGGGAAIDLQESGSGWDGQDAVGLLGPADIDRALENVPPDWPAPIVVVDVPLPSGRREAADQLLLRNYFAAELFAMGGTRAVIATGLASPRSTDVVQDVLVEGLARGNAIGDIVQQMRRQQPAGGFLRFDSALAFAATALWTNDGSMRLPASRRL